MKPTSILPLAGTLAASLLVLTGCATAPEHTGPYTKAEILQQPDVKDQAPAIFPNDLEQVRKASLRALNFVGCEIKTQEPFFLSGARPVKMGLFVNSGGETVKVFLYPQSATETRVWVDTELSTWFLAGQQGWNTQVLTQITNLLYSPMVGGAQ